LEKGNVMFVRINARVMNGGQAREVWFTFETDHTSMEELHAALVRDRSIVGTRYETEKGGPGRRVVRDAFSAIITMEGLVSVMEMQDDLYEEDGTAIWTLAHGEAA
jgi:hypothetical protein